MAGDAQRTIGGWNEPQAAAPVLLTVPDARRRPGVRASSAGAATGSGVHRGTSHRSRPVGGVSQPLDHDSTHAADSQQAQDTMQRVVLWFRSDMAHIILWLVLAAIALSLAAYLQRPGRTTLSPPPTVEPTTLHHRAASQGEARPAAEQSAPVASQTQQQAPRIRITRLQPDPVPPTPPRAASRRSLTQKVDQVLKSRYADPGAPASEAPRRATATNPNTHGSGRRTIER